MKTATPETPAGLLLRLDRETQARIDELPQTIPGLDLMELVYSTTPDLHDIALDLLGVPSQKAPEADGMADVEPGFCRDWLSDEWDAFRRTDRPIDEYIAWVQSQMAKISGADA
ncbi:hypothetical protein [Stieleria mannarensis]|uniref:hypothetical protein n=1 Tax=Stieleria mannarensis TaxID=2755585 RepID=UPI00160006D6|nr:hypothetical protein [Rhodopirellula sp. JC639]